VQACPRDLSRARSATVFDPIKAFVSRLRAQAQGVESGSELTRLDHHPLERERQLGFGLGDDSLQVRAHVSQIGVAPAGADRPNGYWGA
jgi:hypothetical protein